MTSAGSDVADLINLDRYPIAQRGSPEFKAAVAAAQSELAKNGCGCLPAFLSARGLERMAGEARDLAPRTYSGPSEASPYFFNHRTEALASYPENHPLRRQ